MRLDGNPVPKAFAAMLIVGRAYNPLKSAVAPNLLYIQSVIEPCQPNELNLSNPTIFASGETSIRVKLAPAKTSAFCANIGIQRNISAHTISSFRIEHSPLFLVSS